ncbi:MAG: DUF4270 domain-containing protein [Bacteroidota bacterium]|nr:DUF4270 domain-containing protein [Bacteroidota bacterium]
MFKCQFKAALTGVFLLIFLNWGCTKIDTTQLGQNLIPVVDNIHTFETTLDVVANNFDDLSVACDSVHISDLHALGIINNDPYFGKTSANIYAEFKPATYPFVIPDKDSLTLDSVFLVLHYSHAFGDTVQQQRVQVYELTDALKADSNYTTCHTLPYNNFNLLGEKIYAPKDLDDSIHSVRENATNQLRIKISNSFAQQLLDDSTILQSDSAFKEHFKGFAIVGDQSFGGNALSYFSITSTDSRLSIYLTSNKISGKDTLVYDFPLTQLSGHANSIIRERGTSEITNNVAHPASGDNFIYIQTSPGSYAELTIPGLTSLSNRVIHRAELIAEQAYSSTSVDNYFTGPQFLYLDTKDTSTNGTYIPIPCDFTYFSQRPDFSYLGGTRTTFDDGQQHMLSKYVFNISRYVQSIVTKGRNNAVLRLRAPYNIVNKTGYIDRCNQGISPFNLTLNNVAEGRIKLNGTNNTAQRLRLHIVYSDL